MTLPEASEGNGRLAYALSPNVPGLTFNATTRELSGAPTMAGTYDMTYTATDEDGDAVTLAFNITVEEAEPAGENSGGGDEVHGVTPPDESDSQPSGGGGTGTLSPPPRPENRVFVPEYMDGFLTARISWDPSPGATEDSVYLDYDVQACNSAGCSQLFGPPPGSQSTSETSYTGATDQVAGHHRTVAVRATF